MCCSHCSYSSRATGNISRIKKKGIPESEQSDEGGSSSIWSYNADDFVQQNCVKFFVVLQDDKDLDKWNFDSVPANVILDFDMPSSKCRAAGP